MRELVETARIKFDYLISIHEFHTVEYNFLFGVVECTFGSRENEWFMIAFCPDNTIFNWYYSLRKNSDKSYLTKQESALDELPLKFQHIINEFETNLLEFNEENKNFIEKNSNT